MQKWLYLLLLVIIFSACENKPAPPKQPENLLACFELKDLTQKKKAAQAGEWLFDRPEEMHQNLKQYIASNPLRANAVQQKLYIVKLGAFDAKAQEVFLAVKAYLQAYFQIETDTLPAISIKNIPQENKRIHFGAQQIQTGYILEEMLPKFKPKDALALIAFSVEDLFPDENWNFVFGQATLRKGIGVWSLARLGNLNDTATFPLALMRALKIASHETGHMLSMPHCVKNECNLNGSNSLEENDRQTEWLCWECLAKLCYNRNIHPQKHLTDLAAFHKKMATDTAVQHYYQQALTILLKRG